MLSRTYGKPRETYELVDNQSETDKDIAAMTEEQREALPRGLERERGGSLL